MATRKRNAVSEDATSKWPKVVKGTHLTVTTHEDGRTELEWDDDQLLKEVQEAIASVKPGKLYIIEVPDMIETVANKVAAKVTKTLASKKAPAKKTTKGKTK